MIAIASVRPSSSIVERPASAQPTLSALRSCRWFAEWPPTSLATLASLSSLRSFSAGQVIAPEGKSTEAVAVVVKGRIRAVRRGDAGREVTLEAFRAGEICMDGLLDAGSMLPNDWIAAETSLLLFIPRSEFLSQLRTVPEAALSLAREIERRLSRSKAMSASLALADVQTRLHQVLSRLAREEGEPVADGTLIRRCPTQQELGNMIGACRETVSRMIAELARQELVTLEGRKLRISPRFLALPSVAGQA